MVIQIANGVAGDTERLALTDSAQNLPASILENNGKKAKRVTITVETNSCRFTLGETATPTQGTTGIGHLGFTGDVIRLENPDAIPHVQFINAANGASSAIQMTGEYS
jgi:hypothetical protein